MKNKYIDLITQTYEFHKRSLKLLMTSYTLMIFH